MGTRHLGESGLTLGDAMKIHESITRERIVDGVERTMFGTENVGFCIACGEEADGCEPDARKLTCEFCGKPAVYGAEELLLML
jgi:hypothetical protein